MPHYAYDVYLDSRLIDTVFASYKDVDETRRSLINHDGYDPAIRVVLCRSAKRKATP